MKKQVVAIAVASAFAFSAGAFAQGKAGSKAEEMEAVLLVTKVDPASRVAHVRTKKGDTFAVHVPDEAKIEDINPGNRYRVRFSQAVATSIEPGAQPAAAGATREATRGAKAGEGTVTAKDSGVIVSLDQTSLTLRNLEGETQTFKLGEGASAGSVKAGDAVTITYQRPVASRMASSPQPITDPAPPQ